MENESKVKAFSKLSSLLNYYSEYRDRPAKEGFDFFRNSNPIAKC